VSTPQRRQDLKLGLGEGGYRYNHLKCVFFSIWKEYFDILAINVYPGVSNGETYLTIV